jgi:hypothetical protein
MTVDEVDEVVVVLLVLMWNEVGIFPSVYPSLCYIITERLGVLVRHFH